MALAYRIASLDDVPEARREFYKADGDGFRLDLDGLPEPDGLDGQPSSNGLDGLPSAKSLDGLPSSNGLDGPPSSNGLDGLKSALKKEREARRSLAAEIKRFAGLSPEDCHAAKTKAEALAAENIALTQVLSQTSAKLKELAFLDAVERAVKALGPLNGDALPDLAIRAAAHFTIDEELNPYPLDAEQPFKTLEAFLKSLKKTAPFYWAGERFAGSGAAGGGGSAPADWMLSRDKAKDPKAWRAAKNAAHKAGRALTIV